MNDIVDVTTIRQLNNEPRQTLRGGIVTMTPGVMALGELREVEVLKAVARFDRFDADNDPHGEHDLGLAGCWRRAGSLEKSTTSTGRSPTTRRSHRPSGHHARPDHHAGRGILSPQPPINQGGSMRQRPIGGRVAALVAEPTKRKVRKLAVALHEGNSVVELVAGRYVKAVNRIWGTKGEYLSAPDARRHLWHACFASGHPELPMANGGSRNALVRPAHIRAGQGAGCTNVWCTALRGCCGAWVVLGLSRAAAPHTAPSSKSCSAADRVRRLWCTPPRSPTS